MEKYPDFKRLQLKCKVVGTRADISWNHVTKQENLVYTFECSCPETGGVWTRPLKRYKGIIDKQVWEEDYPGSNAKPHVKMRPGFHYIVNVTCALMERDGKSGDPLTTATMDLPAGTQRALPAVQLVPSQRALPAVQLVPSAMEPDQPFEIPVVLDISAFCTTMSWKSENKNIRYQCVGHCVTNDKIPPFPFVPTEAEAGYTAFVKTRPGYCYRVTIEGNVDERLLERTLCDIKAVFSDKEQTEVFEKALKYVENSTMSGLSQINRCHEKKYWDTISQDIMKPLKKDNCGQPANRINSVLHGIFFYAREKVDGTLPTESVYGDVRLVVPIEKLLHPPLHNFFFADFYCMNNESGVHFVTIVVSKKRSFADSYCREYLEPIDIYSNPFIQAVSTPSGYEFKASQKVYVEICYTEDVQARRIT